MHFIHATWVFAGLGKAEPSYLPSVKDEIGVAQAASPFSANNGVSPVVERMRYTTYNCGAAIEITPSPLQDSHRSIADVLWQILGGFPFASQTKDMQCVRRADSALPVAIERHFSTPQFRHKLKKCDVQRDLFSILVPASGR
jgi:hypothetical protein